MLMAYLEIYLVSVHYNSLSTVGDTWYLKKPTFSIVCQDLQQKFWMCVFETLNPEILKKLEVSDSNHF